MDKISLALSALLGLVMVIWLAPSVIAMNRGKVLRNIALWLGIFLALALFHRQFIMEKQSANDISAPTFQQNGPTDKEDGDQAQSPDSEGDSSTYTPPQE